MKCPTCEQPVPPPELRAVNVYCTEVEWELPQYESPSYIGGMRASRSDTERSFSRCYATGQADGQALGQLVMGDVDLVLMPKSQLVELKAKADLFDATKRRAEIAEKRARKAECKLGRVAQVLS